MKYFLLHLFLGSFIVACAMGSKTFNFAREEKAYVACQDKWVRGKLSKICYRECLKRKRGQCVNWKTEIIDLGNEKDYQFFDNSRMVCVKYESVFGKL